MKRVIIFLVLINLAFVATAQANLEFSPIYPLQEDLIGVKGDYYLDDLTAYTALGYGFSTNRLHYKLGSSYQISEQLKIAGQYENWINYQIPSYNSQQGFKADLAYDRSWGEQLGFGIFRGELKDEAESIKTTYISSNYQKELYYSWGKEVNLLVDLISGEVNESGDNYYVSKIRLPIKIEQLMILPQLGYIKSADQISPKYSLNDYIIGHSSEQEGTYLLNLKFERRTEFMPQSENSLLQMSDLITLLTIGDLLKEDEGIKDLSLNATLGLGLSYQMGEADFRFKLVVDDQGQSGLRFNIAQRY